MNIPKNETKYVKIISNICVNIYKINNRQQYCHSNK